MKEIIEKLIDKKNLTVDESRQMIEQIMSGENDPVQTAACLTALRLKGETADEILGAAQVMREKAFRVPHHQENLFDNCGTGGDCSGTFNISTTSAFVIAACDVPMAKHGNRSVSSSCGSADVLEELGANLSLTPEKVGICIDEVGLGFLFAPGLHPAMKAVVPVRRSLGIRTIFNLLGPLTNPAFASHQLIGVFEESYVDRLSDVAKRLGIKKSMIVFNRSGIDEITTAGDNKIALGENGNKEYLELTPEDCGFERCTVEDLKGGNAAHNARITLSILQGDKGPKRDTIVLSSAASLMAADHVANINEGIMQAIECIDSGEAMKRLQSFIEITKDLANAA